jgi:hypothetical protein
MLLILSAAYINLKFALGGAAVRFAEQITLLGGVLLCMVSLTEVVFYLNAANSTSVAEASDSLNLVHATQHLFSMVAAPLVFIPLSIAILRSGVLPRFFGYTGLAFGGLFAVMGGLVLFQPWQFIVDYIAYSQGGWWMAAAITLLIRTQRMNQDPLSAASDCYADRLRP